MDNDVNSVVFTGTLVRDPITRFTDSGSQQTDLTVQVLEVGSTGQQYPLYVPCQTYGELATMADTMHQGESVLISGKLKWHSYTAKDGSKKSSLCVLARLVKRLSAAPVEVQP